MLSGLPRYSSTGPHGTSVYYLVYTKHMERTPNGRIYKYRYYMHMYINQSLKFSPERHVQVMSSVHEDGRHELEGTSLTQTSQA